MLEFATKVIPAQAMTAVQLMQIGIPYNMQRATTDLAEEWGILDEVYDWFDDPEFMNRIMLMASMGPQNQNQGKAGGGGGNSPGAIMQNGGNSAIPNIPSAGKETRQGQQAGANDMQSANFGVY